MLIAAALFALAAQDPPKPAETNPFEGAARSACTDRPRLPDETIEACVVRRLAARQATDDAARAAGPAPLAHLVAAEQAEAARIRDAPAPRPTECRRVVSRDGDEDSASLSVGFSCSNDPDAINRAQQALDALFEGFDD